MSYSRRDLAATEQLCSDLEAAHLDPWWDRELVGGQRWWDEILSRIGDSEAVLFLLSPDSVRSRACRAELDYAQATGRPVVPVLVRDVELDLAPSPLAESQVIDLRERSPESVISLLTALGRVEPPGPVPDPAPEPPAIPMVSLEAVRARVAADSLTFSEQRELVTELMVHAGDVDLQPAVATLVDDLGHRPDLAEAVRADLDALRRQLVRSTSGASPVAAERSAQRAELIDSIATHLETGRLTPILGHGLTDRLIGPRVQLARGWADTFEFPLEPHRRDGLADVAQFVSVMTNPDTVRARLGAYLRELLAVDGEPETTGLAELMTAAWRSAAADGHDAHEVLARLPCPIYVNAHPWGLLSEALREVGRDPVVELCRWRPDTYDWPPSVFETEPGYRPSVERPLVFQVFGALEVPESVVITEDDYLGFVVRVSEERSLIPTPVRRALADSALVMLGFDLNDWDVRALLHTLVDQEGSGRLHRYTHVAAQVDPSSTMASPTRAARYLERYFGRARQPAIDIYWGSVDDFAADLSEAMDGAS